MGKPAWMPINPYTKVDRPLLLDDNLQRVFEQGVKAGQHKLLEYLLNQASAMNLTSETIINVVYVSKMLAMLKELEENHG